jgi:MFS family permease
MAKNFQSAAVSATLCNDNGCLSAQVRSWEDVLAPAERAVGSLQGWILVSISWLGVMATSLISPILPQMAAHYATTPGVETMVQLSIALPALFGGLLAGLVGLLVDRIGRRVVLMVGLVAYALMGMAPLWLEGLQAILVSRCGVGVAEAAIGTAGGALLGDYFRGQEREKWFAVQAGSATLLAVAMLLIGGALGEIGWRAPFIIYALPVLQIALVLAFIREPTRPAAGLVKAQALARFDWRKVMLPAAVSLFSAMAFFVVVIQLGFVLTERGYTSPALISYGAAGSSMAVPLGALLFRLMGRWSIAARLALGFALLALGFMIIGLNHGYGATVMGAAVNGLGGGILVPTMMSWSLLNLDSAELGRGTGVWNTAFSFGAFLSPLSVLVMTGALGSLSSAVLAYGVLTGVGAAIALIAMIAARRTGASQIKLGT